MNRARLTLFLFGSLLFCAALRADITRIVIDGVIQPISDEFIGLAIKEASARGDQALLIVLRTPGGLEDSTRKIVNKILGSKVPVVVYVSPSGSRAASAGFFILQAADIAAMAPGTNTGSAHPVILGGGKADDVMNRKLENDSAAFMRSIAAKRGRNVVVAESAVRESTSFTEAEAFREKLIEVVASSEADLIKQLQGRTITRFTGEKVILSFTGTTVRQIEMSVKQKILSVIMDPNVAFMLLSLGMLALWAEFNHPGAVFPGVVGVISIVLGVFALNILPTRYAALALILLAFVLFALEAKFTSHGILGIGGVICMTIGGLLLVDGPIPEMRVHWLTAMSVSVPLGIIAVFLMTLALRAFKMKVATGQEGMIGERGVAKTALEPQGKVFVHGEIWNAVADEPVDEGRAVVVRGMDGFVLKVTRVE